MEMLSVKKLTFTYPEDRTPAVDNLSLTVNEGEFFVLCGSSGCGKTTLLRHMKRQLSPSGAKSGEVLFEGRPLEALDDREAASAIGFVMQSPENQLVTDRVWHELAFGPESLGLDTQTVRRRVAEMASFFGIESWFYKSVSELSGGQKQLLDLASVMVMQPRLLILDEPTGQLDPIAASDFLATVKKINRELGTTVILTEHRLEEALPLADRAAVMEQGRIICCGSVCRVGEFLRETEHPMFLAMPSAMRIWGSVRSETDCPVSVNEGRGFLKEYTAHHPLHPISEKIPAAVGKELISVTDAWFRYDKSAPDVVKGARLTASEGEILCILGGNGAGKTTLLKLMAGIKKPCRGKINAAGRTAYLPQDPRTLFVKKTLLEDLEDAAWDAELSKEEKNRRIERVLRLCRLSGLQHRHPYDLSGGEQQRAAIAKLLLREPEILLLDEPTKGLDARLKAELAELLRSLCRGAAVIMVSHDVEFCAEYADRCAMFFDGVIVSEGAPREFFANNSFYTTSACRIARGTVEGAVTAEDVIEAIGGSVTKKCDESRGGDGTGETDDKSDGTSADSGEILHGISGTSADSGEISRGGSGTSADSGEISYDDSGTSADSGEISRKSSERLPLWRRICGGISALCSLAILIYGLKAGTLSRMISSGGLTSLGWRRLCLYGVLVVLLILAGILLGGRAPADDTLQPGKKKRLPRRTVVSVAVILLLIPLTLYAGLVLFDSKQYYLTAMAVLIECMLPFFMVFEGRRPRAGELVTVAVLCALSIAGRAAFFMLPQFKPVLAMTVIAGVSLGGETGFLVGAVTMLVSNMMFSQGPWTPWQMFAMGIAGFIAGALFHSGFLRRTKASLCIYGALSAILIYGGIMNPTSALMWGSQSLNIKMILSYYITGFPMDAIHAVATVIFLLILADPMLEKLSRVKRKYGLTE